MAEAAAHPPVRLTPEEVAAIRRIVAAYFGPEAEVRVFGSRARLDVRGGDLDLHVLMPGERPPWRVEYGALDAIARALDDLHVDLVISTDDGAAGPIEAEAMRTGVRL